MPIRIFYRETSEGRVKVGTEEIIRKFLDVTCDYDPGYFLNCTHLFKVFESECENITGFKPDINTLKFHLAKMKYNGFIRNGIWYRSGIKLKETVMFPKVCPNCGKEII